MTSETITITKLEAAEGMVLTDGTTCGREIYLAEDADQAAFYEITEAEYEAQEAKRAEEAEQEANG